MNEIKYCYEKTINYIGGIMSLVVAVLIFGRTYVGETIVKMQANGSLWIFWLVIVATLCFSCAQFLIGMQYRAVAVLSEYGVCIYEKEEVLYSLPWKDIEYIKLLNGSGVRQHIALVSVHASRNDKNFIASCSRLTGKIARKYRLDRAMEKLVRGKITKQQFEAQGVYMLADYPRQYTEIERLWQNSKTEGGFRW